MKIARARGPGPPARRLNEAPGALSLTAMRAFPGLPVSVHGSILGALAAGGFLLAGAAGAQVPLPPRAPVTQMEMNFDLSQGVIRLDVDLGAARAARLVLDTGNPSSAIDLDAARSFGLALDETTKKKMGAGPDAPEYYPLTLARVRLGSETFTNCVFAAAPLSATIADAYGFTCDGTLGYGVFKGRVLQIDFPARKLRLLDSSPAAPSSTAAAPIVWRPYQKGTPPLVTVDGLRIGSRTVPAQVDTFFLGSLILFSDKLAGLETPGAKDVSGLYFEQAKLPAARLKEAVVLGGATYPAGQPVYVAGKGAHLPQTEIAAVLGNAFFQDSVLTLDFQSDRLIVTPSHSTPQSDFPLRTES